VEGTGGDGEFYQAVKKANDVDCKGKTKGVNFRLLELRGFGCLRGFLLKFVLQHHRRFFVWASFGAWEIWGNLVFFFLFTYDDDEDDEFLSALRD
jgi:hypothetical protein